MGAQKKRVVFRIHIKPDAKKTLEGITEKHGITQIAVTSKLVDWFANQPNLIKAAILGLYPDVIQQDVGQLILERMQRGEE